MGPVRVDVRINNSRYEYRWDHFWVFRSSFSRGLWIFTSILDLMLYVDSSSRIVLFCMPETLAQINQESIPVIKEDEEHQHHSDTYSGDMGTEKGKNYVEMT